MNTAQFGKNRIFSIIVNKLLKDKLSEINVSSSVKKIILKLNEQISILNIYDLIIVRIIIGDTQCNQKRILSDLSIFSHVKHSRIFIYRNALMDMDPLSLKNILF